MFDTIRSKFPLPFDHRGLHALEFQTQSFDECKQRLYEIREDGTLWMQSFDAQKERFDTAPPGFVVHRENLRWEQTTYSGNVNFYSGGTGSHNRPSDWIEFNAMFSSGQLQGMVCARSSGCFAG